ncbi:Unknown protein sequence [Pseudomonas syringae pv. aptata]|nr:Unknown protein sequence [Pseudomonas syringae pv. aptata]
MRIPKSATTISGPRRRLTATRVSGFTPSSIRRWASWLAC